MIYRHIGLHVVMCIYYYLCVYVFMYLCTYVRMYVCMCACMHACIYVCMYVVEQKIPDVQQSEAQSEALVNYSYIQLKCDI